MSAVRDTYDNYQTETYTKNTFSFNLIIPKEFSDIKAVSNYIPNGIPVLVNTSQLANKDIVFRVLDYLNGYVDCCSGNLKRLSSELVLVAPYSVQYETDVSLELYGDKEYDKDFSYSYF